MSINQFCLELYGLQHFCKAWEPMKKPPGYQGPTGSRNQYVCSQNPVTGFGSRFLVTKHTEGFGLKHYGLQQGIDIGVYGFLGTGIVFSGCLPVVYWLFTGYGACFARCWH